MLKIGGIIRTYRTQRKLTLKELSEKAEISPSYLSQIENDQVNMNMSVLENLSKALSTPIYLFFIQESIDNISYLCKADRMKIVRSDGIIIEPLVDTQVIQDNVHIMDIPVRYNISDYSAHEGEELFYILEGKMTIDFSGYREIHLEADDSLAFSSKIPHLICSEKGCRVLVRSSTPPSFL